MATKNIIKNWFKTGLKPTQAQFWDTWDSFWHKDEKIPQSSIEGLSQSLTEKADAEALNGKLDKGTFEGDAAAIVTLIPEIAVLKDGDQTINDVKTFTSSPIVPMPTSALQAVTKKYVDDLGEFTTQIIDSGGNYNDLEVTADLLVFTNTNAQAILNGVWGKKDFHILNLSPTYDVKVNHDSSSVTDPLRRIKLPTNAGSVGVKGTARVLYTESYGYFISDTWGSLYRPEFKGMIEEEVVTVNSESNAGSRKIIELKVFRDAQSAPMSKADLNAAYPSSVRGFEVICKLINRIYLKIDDNSKDWDEIISSNVL